MRVSTPTVRATGCRHYCALLLQAAAGYVAATRGRRDRHGNCSFTDAFFSPAWKLAMQQVNGYKSRTFPCESLEILVISVHGEELHFQLIVTVPPAARDPSLRVRRKRSLPPVGSSSRAHCSSFLGASARAEVGLYYGRKLQQQS